MDSVLIFCLREFPWYRILFLYTLIISLMKKQFAATHRHAVLQGKEKTTDP
jgi:hypothetical protein